MDASEPAWHLLSGLRTGGGRPGGGGEQWGRAGMLSFRLGSSGRGRSLVCQEAPGAVGAGRPGMCWRPRFPELARSLVALVLSGVAAAECREAAVCSRNWPSPPVEASWSLGSCLECTGARRAHRGRWVSC